MIGLTLRRLAGKVAMFKLQDKCRQLFRPNQLGVGVPKGAEIAVHTVRHYLSQSQDKEEILLKVDFKNAFNTLRRDQILAKVKQHVPQLTQLLLLRRL